MTKFNDLDALEKLDELLGFDFREFAERFIAAQRVSHSETYAEIVRSTDRLASASLRLFAEKSKSEQAAIWARVTEVSEDLNRLLEKQPALVVALTLLTAIRVHEQLCNRARAATARA
jgi:hypothetical protein